MSSDLGAQLQVRSLALKVMGADSLIQLGAKKEKKSTRFNQAGFQNLTLTRSWKWLEGTEHPRKGKGQDFALWQIALR